MDYKKMMKKWKDGETNRKKRKKRRKAHRERRILGALGHEYIYEGGKGAGSEKRRVMIFMNFIKVCIECCLKKCGGGGSLIFECTLLSWI